MDLRRWDEIQAAFDQLVQLDVAERSRRLETLGRTDPELRAAVEAMLAGDAGAESRLASLDAALGSPAAALPDPFGLSGRTVVHFQVGEPLGKGGMGAVYRALDTRLGRPVALKFLLPFFDVDDTAKARFLREAQAGGALDHPNLCTVYEVGTSDDGQLFLAMALYEGETLKVRLEREGKLPVGAALGIARQVAEGLECAHSAGIVHRDLKPGNIMLLPDGAVKILDFGLAKARDQTQSLTETGARLGTVLYMSPEQVRGDAVDGRTDLWALGVVLYEMLTGRVPFGGGEQIATAHAIIHADPVPSGMLRADVPAAVEELVLRLLEKNPAARFATARALWNALVTAEHDRAGLTPWLRRHWRRVQHQVRAHRRMIAALAAAVMLGAMAVAAVVGRQSSTPTAPSRTTLAVLPLENLSRQAQQSYFVDGLHEEILNQLYKVPVLKVIARASVLGYAGANRPPLREIARDLGVGSIVQGGVRISGNRARVDVQLVDPTTATPLWTQSYDRTLRDAFAIESDIAREIVATVGVVLGSDERSALTSVPTQKGQAYLLYLQGKEIERRPGGLWSHDNLEAAAQLYRQAIALDSGFALAHAALAINHAWMYIARYDMTTARLDYTVAEAQTALRLAPDLPQAHEAMGVVYNIGPNTNPQRADQEWQLALRSAPNDVRLLQHRLAFFRQTGNWQEYEQAFLKLVELDPRNADLLSDYGGGTHVRMGRFADAIHWYDRAMSLMTDTLGVSQAKAWIYVAWKGDVGPLRAWMRGEPGRVLRRNGGVHGWINFLYTERQPDSLLQLLKESREPVFQGAFSFEPIALWSAAAHELRGDSAAARAAYDSALVIADSAVRRYPQDFSVHQARGMSLAGLGRRAEALEEVRTIRGNYLNRDVWVRERLVIGIAHIHAELGDAKATVDDLEELLSRRETALTIHVLRLDPGYDRIRRDPLFQALLTKYANHPNLRS